MHNQNINFIDSILTTKASGLDSQVEQDLLLPQGKSIAELLNDKEEKTDQNENNITE